MADFVKHIACPICGSRDNLAIYDDGSEWCFGCKHYKPPDKFHKVRNKESCIQQELTTVALPNDFTIGYYPKESIDWINKYELSKPDLVRHHIGWSETKNRLCFPIIVDGDLLAWQGRSFNEKPKWISYGKIHEFVYHLEAKTDTLWLVEDVVSAIKLNKYLQWDVAPLFGSQLTNPQKKCILLMKQYTSVGVWLDRDKYKEATKIARSFSEAGYSTAIRCTELDPKEIPACQLSSP